MEKLTSIFWQLLCWTSERRKLLDNNCMQIKRRQSNHFTCIQARLTCVCASFPRPKWCIIWSMWRANSGKKQQIELDYSWMQLPQLVFNMLSMIFIWNAQTNNFRPTYNHIDHLKPLQRFNIMITLWTTLWHCSNA